MPQAKHTLTIEGDEVILINGFPLNKQVIHFLSYLRTESGLAQETLHSNITRYAIYRSWQEIGAETEFKLTPEFLVEMEHLIDVVNALDDVIDFKSKED